MTVATEPVLALSVDLEHRHTPLAACKEIPEADYRGTFYAVADEPLSVAVLPATGAAYEAQCSRAVRENANYCRRLGYRHERIDRADWEDDLHALRSSATHRQGRAMPAAYMERQTYPSDIPAKECPRHVSVVHGVIGSDGHLAGYCQIVQCGEMARTNTILGHADRLPDRVMWLLYLEAIKWHIDHCGAAFAMYYAHNSGKGPGLRYWKERFGFRPARVEWVW